MTMKKTINAFKKWISESRSAELAKLVTPVMNQSGRTADEFWDFLHDVSQSPYGAAAGFGGFIYYTETTEFWRKHRKTIMAYCQDFADGLGENVMSMVSKFKTIKDAEVTEDEIGRALYGNYDEDLTQIYNTMTWLILEEVAYCYSEWEYEREREEE